jgi:hypothetical protein
MHAHLVKVVQDPGLSRLLLVLVEGVPTNGHAHLVHLDTYHTQQQRRRRACGPPQLPATSCLHARKQSAPPQKNAPTVD